MFSQSPQPSFINYTVSDGLPSSEIHSVLQDKHGYIWFTTNNGVSKYNGYEFVTFTTKDGLTDNSIVDLYEDYKGRIWVSSVSGGLSYFENGEIKKYPHNEILIKNQNLNYSTLKIDSQNNIYVVSESAGLIKISPKGVVLFASKSPNIELEYLNAIDNKINTNSLTLLNRIKGFSFEKNLFVYNTNYEVILYNLKTNTIIDFLIFDRNISNIQKLGSSLFVSISEGGVKKYSIENNRLTLQDHLFDTYTITGALIDEENGYWFTTTQKGVLYTPNIDVLSYIQDEGTYPMELLVHNDRLVIGYENNMQYLSGDNLSQVFDFDVLTPKNEGKPSNIHQDGCLISDGKFKLVNRCTKFLYPNKTSSNCVSRFFSGDSLYLFTKTEGFIFSKEGVDTINYRGNYNNIEDLLLNDDGSFWIGDITGLYKETPSRVIKMSELNSVFSNHVVDLAQSKKHGLVVATRGAGIIVFKNNEITIFDTDNGLMSDEVNSVYIDSFENVWAATGRGLHKLAAENLNKIDFYSISDGLVSNEITDVRRIKNKVYVGTKRGLSIININNFKIDTNPINVRIVLTKLNNSVIENKSIIDIGPADKYFEIEYLGLNYKALGNIEYKYRIKELSDEWHYTTNRNLRLDVFPENGVFTIEFKARKLPNGDWSKQSAVTRLKFHPPFYKTWWFRLLMLSVLMLIIYIAFKVNLIAYNKKIQQEIVNRLLKKLGRDKYLIIESNKEQIRIKESQILFLESFKDYVEINTINKKYLYRSTMKNMEIQLSPSNFMRVHRSYIIQKDKIDSISKDQVKIGDRYIPVGKTYREEVKELKNQFSRLNQ